jgi:hypothetical protein
MSLQRLVLDFRTGELVVRCLYCSKEDSNPGTKTRRREVTELPREGLRRALASLESEADAELVGCSGFTNLQAGVTGPAAGSGRARGGLEAEPEGLRREAPTDGALRVAPLPHGVGRKDPQDPGGAR